MDLLNLELKIFGYWALLIGAPLLIVSLLGCIYNLRKDLKAYMKAYDELDGNTLDAELEVQMLKAENDHLQFELNKLIETIEQNEPRKHSENFCI